MRAAHLLATSLLLSTFAGAPAAAAAPRPPRLTVVVTVDGLSTDLLLRLRPRFGRGGMERLLGEGAVFEGARYGALGVASAPAHATLVTGTYPYRHGLVGALAYDRTRRRFFGALADPSHPLLEAPLDSEEETSPLAFATETIADRLKLATDGKGKVIAVGLSGSPAILLAGHLGQAYWFSEATGRMTSSTFYTKELPDWVKAFNEKRLPEAAFGKTWERALSEGDYAGRDDAAWEESFNGLGRLFPHPLNGGLERPGAPYFAAWTASPAAQELVAAFARAAVEGQGLGKDEIPDLLLISFGSTERAGRLFGPDSHEMQDLMVRLDRTLSELLTGLERSVGGKQNLLVALAGTHGFAPAPELLAGLAMPSGRLERSTLWEAVRKELGARFGEAGWVQAIDGPNVFLDSELVAQRRLDPAAVQVAAAQAAARVPGVAHAFARAQLQQGAVAPPAAAVALAAARTLHPERSGDVLLVPRPFVVWGRADGRLAGTGSGTPYSYDVQVPLVFWGFGLRPGLFRDPVDTVDFAPTLTSLLGMGAPAMSEGGARPELTR